MTNNTNFQMLSPTTIRACAWLQAHDINQHKVNPTPAAQHLDA